MARLKPEECAIYFDMDNVLVLFSTRENEDEQLKKMYNKGFYRSLDPMYGAFKVVEILTYCGLDVRVISGLIDSPYVAEEKLEWCRANLAISEDKVTLLPYQQRKVDYVKDLHKGCILIDDFPRYVNEWREEGGTAVLLNRKAETSTDEEISKLYEILLVLLNMIEFSYDDRCCILDTYFDLKRDSEPKKSLFGRKKHVRSQCRRNKGSRV